MKIELMPFQVQRTREFIRKFQSAIADFEANQDLQSLALSAPTGAGKTVIATSFIEQLLFGSEQVLGDLQFTFLWLTDQPQLNEQTARKMLNTSDIDEDRIVLIDESFIDDQLRPGSVYLLNTQKLGANSSLVNTGGFRQTSLWDALTNTVSRDPSRFVLVIDEAHRGMRDSQADPDFASTIVQRFIKGASDFNLPAVPLVVGISATIQRFHDLIGTTNRTERKVEVTVKEVRESGLVKSLIRLRNTSVSVDADMTMLAQAIKGWKEYRDFWARYAANNSIELLDPILLIQVEDGTSSVLTKSPLVEILSTVHGQIESIGPEWVAHAFQTGASIDGSEFGYPVRYIAPSNIEMDPDVRVVLFKSSLNTGWDCPRAEVMVSFRPARDSTSIAQLIGRMVRARLAKEIKSFDVLNTALVMLPKYDKRAVSDVVEILNGGGDSQTGSDSSDDDDVVWMKRASGEDFDAAFDVLSTLPSMVMPSSVRVSPIDRLFRVAGLLAEVSFLERPSALASEALLEVLIAQYEMRKDSDTFLGAIGNASNVDILGVDHEYGQSKASDVEILSVERAQSDIEHHFCNAEKFLGSRGLANAYLARRLSSPEDENGIKAEFCVLTSDGGVLAPLFARAEELTNEWLVEYRTRFSRLSKSDEEHFGRYLEILAVSGQPETGTVVLPEGLVQWSKGRVALSAPAWTRHLYLPMDGEDYREVLNTWESAVLQQELSDPVVVAWLRNLPRKRWSLCVAYQSGASHTPFYPDFIVFSKNGAGDVEASIVDPHLLNDSTAPQRSAGLARYAEANSTHFRRIDIIIVQRIAGGVDVIKRLNLMNPSTRNEVAKVTTSAHLESLFNSSAPYP